MYTFLTNGRQLQGCRLQRGYMLRNKSNQRRQNTTRDVASGSQCMHDTAERKDEHGMAAHLLPATSEALPAIGDNCHS